MNPRENSGFADRLMPVFLPALKKLFPAAIFLFVFSCVSGPKGRETQGLEASTADVRRLVELGSPDSLTRAAALLQEDPGADPALNAAAAALWRALYPGIGISFPAAAPDHRYAKILDEAGRGTYSRPVSSRDFLEYVLPFLAYYHFPETAGTLPNSFQLRSALTDLEKAGQLNPESALPALFRAFVSEKTGNAPQAEKLYRQALELAGDCYPAELGLAWALGEQGKGNEALELLTRLLARYPANLEIRKQLARLYIKRREWAKAGGQIDEILRQDSRDGEFLLLRARVLVEQGQYQQAQAVLDSYAFTDSARLYHFLRARIQAEGFRNQEAALNYLRPLAKTEDPEISLYTASLLMDSPRTEDNAEGRAILNRLLASSTAPAEVLALAVNDEVKRESWKEAKAYLDRLLVRRRDREDLLNAYKVERGLGNHAAALSHARELYNLDSSAEETVSAYVTALIDTGRQSEASQIIEKHLTAAPSGPRKSRYYYLRSRLRNNDDAVMNDLRASLFEDPRNLDALTAIFEMYHRRKDERRAAYYLKQALGIAPNNPHLKRYEPEYRSLMNN